MVILSFLINVQAISKVTSFRESRNGTTLQKRVHPKLEEATALSIRPRYRLAVTHMWHFIQ